MQYNPRYVRQWESVLETHYPEPIMTGATQMSCHIIVAIEQNILIVK